MNLPDKHDIIEMIAQGNVDRYRSHRDAYGKFDCYSISDWTYNDIIGLTDIEEIHNLFMEIDDSLFDKYGNDYEERSFRILQWAVKRYLTEIDNRIGELL